MTQFAASPVTGTTSGHDSARSAGAAAVRENFAADELAIVLSHYDLGVIESLTEFPRGSRKAPKLVIHADAGRFLLKRRAKGRDDPFRVAFCHQIQLHLTARQFPLPHLIGTRRENNSMLQLRGSVYELFEYIIGQGYSQSLESTSDAGRILAVFHTDLLGFRSEHASSGGSYHAMEYIEQALKQIPAAMCAAPDAAPAAAAGDLGPPTKADCSELLAYLLESYQGAAKAVADSGYDHWPKQIVHADWHPGNMLFRDDHVVAVIDYDSARTLPKVIDVANGALQFSIVGGDDDVSKWPAELNGSRYRAFLAGYDKRMPLSKAEYRVLPHLMIEALIAEAALPIAATGTFGRTDGLAFLQMVRRKVEWIRQNTVELGEPD